MVEKFSSGCFSKITGTGIYVPNQIITSTHLEESIGYTKERRIGWIKKVTGIEERRWCGPGEDMYTMAIHAADAALRTAHLTTIDTLILARSRYTDPRCPVSAGAIHQGLEKLGYEVNEVDYADGFFVCSGSLTALHEADLRIRAGEAKRVLVIASSVGSAFANFAHPQTACLWGDGAGAMVIESSDYPGILTYRGKGISKLWDSFQLRTSSEGKPYVEMNGRDVYQAVVSEVPQFIRETIQRINVSLDSVSLFLFHQANGRMLSLLCERLGISEEKTYNNVQCYGNTTCASIPLVYHESLERGLLKRGEICLMASFGVGFHMNCMLYRN